MISCDFITSATNYCANNPCGDHGRCYNVALARTFFCSCNYGYSGTTCKQGDPNKMMFLCHVYVKYFKEKMNEFGNLIIKCA